MIAIVTLTVAVLILRRLMRDAPRVEFERIESGGCAPPFGASVALRSEPEFLAVRPAVKAKARRKS